MIDFDRESMLEMFIFEMSQLVDQLESTIVQSEAEYNSDQINEIFRIMHTIKGSSAMMMYDNIAGVAHVVEDLFYYLREEAVSNIDNKKLSDHVLSGADFIKAELGKLQSGAQPDGDGSELARNIELFLKQIKSGGAAPAEQPAPIAQATDVAQPDPSTSESLTEQDCPYHYEAKIRFKDGCEMENVRAFTLVYNLGDIAKDLIHTPKDVVNEASIPLIRENGFLLEFASSYDYNYVFEHLNQTIYLEELTLTDISKHPASDVLEQTAESNNDVVEVGVTVQPAPPPATPVVKVPDVLASIQAKSDKSVPVPVTLPVVAPATPTQDDVAQVIPQVIDATPQRGAAQTSASVISVNVNKLDALLNIVSELVMSEAMVTQNPDLEGLLLDSFHREARALRKNITNLRQAVMSMRMVPLSTTFFKMNRIVRDMQRQLHKDVKLDIQGEETEVDKNIIEQIADPIIHIIRNCIDHGIESPEERDFTGKPKRASLLLEARNSGGDVLIIIQDDGRGIDTEKVLNKAKASGILTKPEMEYTEKEIHQFIFLPGFSTNDKVTAFSGRGVGMDVVSSNLAKVHGTATVDSVRGEGTTFTLKIPLTLAIIESMRVSVAGTQYTIPIASIIKSFKANSSDLFTDPNGNEMITDRGEVFNIVRMHEFFNIEGAVTNIEDGILVMLENDGEVLCLLVDYLLGQQQAVLKPMPKYFKKVRGLGGCTLLGNGAISLIIDVPGFFDK